MKTEFRGSADVEVSEGVTRSPVEMEAKPEPKPEPKPVTCWNCQHHPMCSYLARTSGPFPFKGGDEVTQKRAIEGYKAGMGRVLAEACAFYKEVE